MSSDAAASGRRVNTGKSFSPSFDANIGQYAGRSHSSRDKKQRVEKVTNKLYDDGLKDANELRKVLRDTRYLDQLTNSR